MKLERSSDMMEDPLAGCIRWVRADGNYQTLIQSVFLRLQILYMGGGAEKLRDRLRREAKTSKIHEREYFINELLYEYRNGLPRGLKKTTPEFETLVLREWCKSLMRRHGMDAMLDFHLYITKKRKTRVRE